MFYLLKKSQYIEFAFSFFLQVLPLIPFTYYILAHIIIATVEAADSNWCHTNVIILKEDFMKKNIFFKIKLPKTCFFFERKANQKTIKFRHFG